MAKCGLPLTFFVCLCLWLYFFHVVEGKSTVLLHRGEKCGSSNSNSNGTKDHCDSARYLECSNGVCDCKSGYTISRNGTKCLEIARYGLESSCEESIQCWKSLLGRLAECHIGTNKCSCYESETLPIVYHRGRCNYGEALGEYCQIEGLCSATTANAICRSGTCQCQSGFVPSWDKSRCLSIAQGLNSSCEENIQCEKSSLGTLSECNPDRMQCECYEIPQVPTVFHGGRCYFGAGLGDTCQVNSQCTSKTEHAICGKDGKCSCEYPYVSNVNQSECIHVPIHIAAADGTGTGFGIGFGFGTGTGTEAGSGGSTGLFEFRHEPFQCIEDNHCSSKYGFFSRCNSAKGKCECFNPDNNSFIKELKGSNSHPHSNPMIIANLHVDSGNYTHSSGHYHGKVKDSPDNIASGSSSSSLASPSPSPSASTSISTFTSASTSTSSATLSTSEEGMKCYTTKYLGQTCKFHAQCSTVTENSLCVGGLCECREASHVPSEDRRKCLEIAYGFQSPCDEDAQCTKSPLGSLSTCNSVNHKCECSRDFPVVYHESKCYLLRQLGATCESSWECRSHLNSLAECYQGRCQCGRNSTPVDDNSCILHIHIEPDPEIQIQTADPNSLSAPLPPPHPTNTNFNPNSLAESRSFQNRNRARAHPQPQSESESESESESHSGSGSVSSSVIHSAAKATASGSTSTSIFIKNDSTSILSLFFFNSMALIIIKLGLACT